MVKAQPCVRLRSVKQNFTIGHRSPFTRSIQFVKKGRNTMFVLNIFGRSTASILSYSPNQSLCSADDDCCFIYPELRYRLYGAIRILPFQGRFTASILSIEVQQNQEVVITSNILAS